jgi:hypothetical protein
MGDFVKNQRFVKLVQRSWWLVPSTTFILLTCACPSCQVGDVVVGRVTEVAQKRWKMDVNGRQDAALMLSSVNLPGGVQR